MCNRCLVLHRADWQQAEGHNDSNRHLEGIKTDLKYELSLSYFPPQC